MVNDKDDQAAAVGDDAAHPPMPRIIHVRKGSGGKQHKQPRPKEDDVDGEYLSSDSGEFEEPHRLSDGISAKRKIDMSDGGLNGSNKRSRQGAVQGALKIGDEDPDEDCDDAKNHQGGHAEGNEGLSKDAIFPVGFKVSKRFAGGYYYTGSVAEGPRRFVESNGEVKDLYAVEYNDGDGEDLSVAALHRYGKIYKQHMHAADSAGLPAKYKHTSRSKRAACDDVIEIDDSSDDDTGDNIEVASNQKFASLPKKKNRNPPNGAARDDAIEIDSSDDDYDDDDGNGSKYKCISKPSVPTINKRQYPKRKNIKTPTEASKEEEARFGFGHASHVTKAKIMAVSPSATKSTAKVLPTGIACADYAEAKKDLCRKMGVTSEEVVAALDAMTPPYRLNEAMQLIHKSRTSSSTREENLNIKFMPHIGMKVRRHFAGRAYNGVVVNDGEEKVDDDTGETIRMWQVNYEDDDFQDMDFHELLRYRANRPTSTHSSRGRQMLGLELFSGCGAVTQEFVERKWQFRSSQVTG